MLVWLCPRRPVALEQRKMMLWLLSFHRRYRYRRENRGCRIRCRHYCSRLRDGIADEFYSGNHYPKRSKTPPNQKVINYLFISTGTKWTQKWVEIDSKSWKKSRSPNLQFPDIHHCQKALAQNHHCQGKGWQIRTKQWALEENLEKG